MTNEKRILLLLAKGQPKTYAQLEVESGLTRKQVCSVLASIKPLGYVVAHPVAFSILPRGIEKASVIDPEPVEATEKRELSSSFVAAAIPNSVFALGGAHA